jgi:ABC-2 type transport system permease protein
MKKLHKILKGFDHLSFFYKEEFRNIFSDPGILLIFIGAILIYPILYGYVYSNEVLKEVPVALVDLSKTSESRLLARMVDASEFIALAEKANSLEEAERKFYHGSVHGIIVIPNEFATKILSGKQANVSVYCDASYFLYYKQVFKGASFAVGTYSAGVEVKKLMAKGIPTDQALKKREPIPVITNPLYNPSEGYGSYVMLAVLPLILQQTLLIGIGMLGGTTRERKRGHYLIPVGQKKGGTIPIVLGKATAYLTLYVANTIYVLGIMPRMFNYAHRADWLTMTTFTLPFLLSIIFLGMALASIYRNREHSMLVLVFTSIPFIFFSGISWPYEALPSWIKVVAQLIPSTPGIRGLLKLNLMGAPFFSVIWEWLHLWILTIAYFIFACIMTKRFVRRRQQEQIAENE